VAQGAPPPDLAVLVEKIRRHAYRVTDEDVNALRARYSEDQLFELIVAAALGAAEHRLERALAALEDA
jgi:alkylhydroperoxidase family enzyme